MQRLRPAALMGFHLVATVLSLAAALVVPVSITHAQSDKQRLVLAKISDNPRDDLVGMRPLLEYVVDRLRPMGIVEGDIVLARDQRQMASYLRQGKVDWVTETYGLALVIEQQTDATIRLLRRKYGERSYRSTIFVRNDSTIQTLADLAGKTIAFEHPTSTSGYLIPALEIRRSGANLGLMASPIDRPIESTVGYLFSYDEINTSTWVHKGIVDAGAAADTDFKRDFQVPEPFRGDFRSIYTSEAAPRSVELLNSSLPEPVLQAIIQILIDAEGDPAGRKAMELFQGTTGFEGFDASQWPISETFESNWNMLLELNY